MILTLKLRLALVILAAVLITGTLGFYFIEGWSILDSFYTAITTMATVGYGDFTPKTAAGKIFAVAVIIFGVGTMLYSFSLVTELIIEGRLRRILGRGKLLNMINKMDNHYIICGCGRIGLLICRELAGEKVPFVVVDSNPEIIQKIQDEGFIYCKGDATQDKILLEAGIKRAKGIVCVLPTDAENLYVILTAKELNRDIYILSRSEEEESEHRLIRAGANRVISPYTLGGSRMAMAILRPAMLDFIEITTQRQSLELRMEEVAVGDGSRLIGQSLEESEVRQSYGLIVVAVKNDTEKMIFNPQDSYIITNGDRIIALGESINVKRFAEACTT